MLRTCTLFGILELALLAACLGAPSAYADPAEECCGDYRGAECSGCLNGYILGPGDLWGCLQAAPYPGCLIREMDCHTITTPIQKYVEGSGCTVRQEMADGIIITKLGCAQTYCD